MMQCSLLKNLHPRIIRNEQLFKLLFKQLFITGSPNSGPWLTRGPWAIYNQATETGGSICACMRFPICASSRQVFACTLHLHQWQMHYAQANGAVHVCMLAGCPRNHPLFPPHTSPQRQKGWATLIYNICSSSVILQCKTDLSHILFTTFVTKIRLFKLLVDLSWLGMGMLLRSCP